jgi:hypothetical protein
MEIQIEPHTLERAGERGTNMEEKMKTIKSLKVCLVIFMICSFFIVVNCETKKTGSVEQVEQQEVKKDLTCTLLSKEEVEAVLKRKFKEPKPDDILCIYETAESSPFISLVVQLNPTEPDIFMKTREDFMKIGTTFKSIDGIGDSAYFYNEQLNVLSKNHELSLRIQGGLPSEDNFKELAKKAVDRIP